MLNSGVIVLWFGAIGNIPTGFVICDGNNGTPNLKNKFIVGAGDTYAVDDTGGAVEHDHDFITNGHTHNLPGGAFVEIGFDLDNITQSSVDAGTTNNGSSLPPFHALAYIMKT